MTDQQKPQERCIGGKSIKGRLIRKGKRGHRLKVTGGETPPADSPSAAVVGGHSSLSVIGRSSFKRARDLKDDLPYPTWSVKFREPAISLSPDRFLAIGSKGWSTVLLTHGANFGCWYFEVILGDGNDWVRPKRRRLNSERSSDKADERSMGDNRDDETARENLTSIIDQHNSEDVNMEGIGKGKEEIGGHDCTTDWRESAENGTVNGFTEKGFDKYDDFSVGMKHPGEFCTVDDNRFKNNETLKEEKGSLNSHCHWIHSDGIYETIQDEEAKSISPDSLGPLRCGVDFNFIGWPRDGPRIEPHVRVGWSCRYSRLDVPIASDQFGICLRDSDGSVVQRAKRKPYAETQLGHGSVIGCAIVLGPPAYRLADPRAKPELHPFLEAGLLCDPARPPRVIPNAASSVEFTVNGRRIGPASIDLPTGTYHPAVSLYMGAHCRINLGPQFIHPPPLLPSAAQELTGFSVYHPATRLPKPDY